MVQTLCGPKFGIMSMTFIMLYTYGCCITFQIVLGDQLDRVFEAITDTSGKWYLDRRFTISIIALLTIFPLCIPKVSARIITIYKVSFSLRSLKIIVFLIFIPRILVSYVMLHYWDLCPVYLWFLWLSRDSLTPQMVKCLNQKIYQSGLTQQVLFYQLFLQFSLLINVTCRQYQFMRL